jgi:dynein heavy chain
LEQVIEEAESTTPIFFILSSGADPIKDVQKIAKKKGIIHGKTMFDISLG